MVSQLAEKPFRTVVVMTKTDVADSFGTTIDAKVLEKALGVRVPTPPLKPCRSGRSCDRGNA